MAEQRYGKRNSWELTSHKQEAERESLGLFLNAFWHSKLFWEVFWNPQWHTSSDQATLPNSSQTRLPSGNHVFKHMCLRQPFSSKPNCIQIKEYLQLSAYFISTPLFFPHLGTSLPTILTHLRLPPKGMHPLYCSPWCKRVIFTLKSK